jgi:hypothetical protein
MSRSSNRIIRFNESDEFLDFNEFGPDADADGGGEIVMTLDEFVNLGIFTLDNCQKAVLCLKNNETCDFENDEESVTMSSTDAEKVTVKYGDIELDFDKEELLGAFQEKIDMSAEEVVESVKVEEEKEMQSVLKFKDFLELEKFEAKHDGKDSF